MRVELKVQLPHKTAVHLLLSISLMEVDYYICQRKFYREK